MACPVPPLSHAFGLADSTALSFCPGILFCTQTCQIWHLSKCIGELCCSLCILTSTLHCPPPHLCSPGTAECVMCKKWQQGRIQVYGKRKTQKNCKKAQIQGVQSVRPRCEARGHHGGEPLYTNSGRIVRFFSLLWHMVVDLYSYLTALLLAACASYRLDGYRLCLMWYWDPACVHRWHSAKGLNVPHAGLRS